ncbi:MAG TPA: hypothetical protein VGQ83_00535, partial [Polyangia bacterium]
MSRDDDPREPLLVPPNWRTPEWCRDAGILWESWAANGEVCITGLTPPAPGLARLAHRLTWTLRSFASRCRRTYDGTGALEFVYHGPRDLTTLARSLCLDFDLALCHPELMGHRIRQCGGDPGEGAWPQWWLEGDTYEWFGPGAPIPRGRTAKPKVVVLAEEQQVLVSAAPKPLGSRVRAIWTRSLDVLGRVDEKAAFVSLAEGQQAFLATMLVLIHERPERSVRPRPTLEESYARHAGLIAELAPAAHDRHLPVAWHALWRLPPAMLWDDP